MPHRHEQKGVYTRYSDDRVPVLPTDAPDYTHRVRPPQREWPWYVLVARPVERKEFAQSPEAQAALNSEWGRFRVAEKKGCWDESAVRERVGVRAESHRTGANIHVGRILEICVERGSDLPKGRFQKVRGKEAGIMRKG